MRVPSGWTGKETENLVGGGGGEIVVITDEGNENDTVTIEPVPDEAGTTPSTATDHYIAAFHLNQQEFTREKVTVGNGQADLIVFGEPLMSASTTRYFKALLFLQPANLPVLRIDAWSAPHAGETVLSAVLSLAETLRAAH